MLYTTAHCNDSNYKLTFKNSHFAKLEETQQEELERPLLQSAVVGVQRPPHALHLHIAKVNDNMRCQGQNLEH